MAYIGRQLVRGQNRIYDDISSSFNGSTTAFNLTIGGDATPPAQVNQLWIILGGILQKPGTDFTVADAQVTFTTAPAAGLDFWAMIQGDTSDMNAPSDGSVTPTKIATSGDFSFPADIRLKDADGSHYVGIQAPTTVSSNLVWTLPASDGSANQYLKTNGSGTLSWASDTATDPTKMPLAGGTFTGDVIFDNATHAGFDITWDMSDKALEFTDGVKSIFGTGSDFQLYHDGSNSYITNATGNIAIEGKAGEMSVKCIPDGAVELYHNDSKKCETISTGVSITGSLGIGTTSPTGFNANADELVLHNGSGTCGLTISCPNDSIGRIAFGDPQDNNIGELKYEHSSNALLFVANAAERMRIDSSGDVGIGESASIDARLHVNSGTDNTTLFIESTDGDTNFGMADNAGSCRLLQEGGNLRFRTGGNANAFGTGDSERMVLDSNGRLIIGHTTSTGEARALQVVGTTGDTASVQLIRHSANASCPNLDFSKSRNATKGSYTVVNDDDALGQIVFRGDDGTDINSPAATITCSVDGTPGSNDMPGRLTFSTSPDGSNATSERMRISSAGYVGIKETNPEDYLQINTTGGSNKGLTFLGTDNHYAAIKANMDRTGSDNYILAIRGKWDNNDVALITLESGADTGNKDDGEINFFTSSTGGSPEERLSIKNDGDVYVQTGDLVIATSGKGIDFSASGGPQGTGNELLDDYEEGTWTPTAYGQTTAGTTSYSSQNGYYTKIGRLVTITCAMDFTTSGGSGRMQIGGVPFTCSEEALGPFQCNNMGLSYQTDITQYNSIIQATNAYAHFRGTANDGGSFSYMQIQDMNWVRFTLSYQAST